MSKLNYKTSKDYKRLKELLDSGEKVIAICEEEYIGFAFKEEDTGDYYFGGRIGITYFIPENFEKNCEHDRIEFIEPNGEE
jgi:hypothetical protein